MPYVSQAQDRYFNANKKKLEAQGVNVDEWNAASKGLKLPPRAPKRGPVTQAFVRFAPQK